MLAQHSRLMTYTELRGNERVTTLRRLEIPNEHAVSLPLPTKRWGEPAYAFFASPARRRPRQPMEQAPPDMWWAISAVDARLLIYAASSILPYAKDEGWKRVTLPRDTRTLDQAKNDISVIERSIDDLAPAFFEGDRGSESVRHTLIQALVQHVPDLLMPQYLTLVPDFFEWLKS